MFIMKKLIVCLLLVMSSSTYAQSYFSKVYEVKIKGRDTVNLLPNFLLSIIEKDSFIYAIGYSSDSSQKSSGNNIGISFYQFNKHGGLLDYYRITEPIDKEFFPKGGIQTFDGIEFYTVINDNYRDAGILQFNRINRKTAVFSINNLINPDYDINRSNLIATLDSDLITANSIITDPVTLNYKVQVNKLNAQGEILWQRVVGKPTERYYNNYPYSSEVDRDNNILIGTSYDNYNGIINYPKFESVVYKFSPEGDLLKTYNSPPSKGFGPVYDICIDEEQTIFLACDTIFTLAGYPSSAVGYGAIQVLDSNMNFKRLIKVEYPTYGQFGALCPLKLINSNDHKDLVGAFRLGLQDTFLYPGVPWPYLHTIINLKQIRKDGSLKWSRSYRIREGRDDGLVYDLKGDQDKQGYYIAAFSYKYMDEDSITEPYYMPWLLHVDNEGCVVPGCANLVQTDSALPVEKKNYFLFYPVPADDMLTLYHEEIKAAHISIRNESGVLVDELTTAMGSETILIPLQYYASGLYFVTMTTADGHHSTKSFVKN